MRDEPRFWVPVGFLAAATAFFVLALSTLSDEGAAFGWAGVASGFLTAGLVDLFGLLEGRRQRLALERQLAPVRASMVQHLRAQRRDLYETLTTLLPVSGDPADWIAELSANDWPVMPNEPADIYPPQTKGARVAQLNLEMQRRQEHLEGLAAGGILTESIAAMSDIVLRGSWASIIGVLTVAGGSGMSGVAAMAAEMLEKLQLINMPEA